MINKVSNAIKKEIRKRFEAGEDLKELAYEFRLSYGTLRNLSSKEKWQKGINSTLLYLQEVQNDIEQHLEEKEEIKGHYKNLHKSTLAYLIELERKKERPTNKGREDALRTRIATHRDGYQFAKELYSIMNPEEELDYKIKLARYQAYKDEILADEKEREIKLDSESIDLKLKKIELKTKERKAKAYGVVIDE
ncbi:MAG: hypothetical protein ACRDCE_21650 [Cetobacterium sp.]|uniref:hypothetical protein n=1 Tax=unclassified Cetobacterium TaxID=2630983 RepID=UPI000645FA92|nr:hypothetical protein [Cetobacterium sp. ZWU0022]